MFFKSFKENIAKKKITNVVFKFRLTFMIGPFTIYRNIPLHIIIIKTFPYKPLPIRHISYVDAHRRKTSIFFMVSYKIPQYFLPFPISQINVILSKFENITLTHQCPVSSWRKCVICDNWAISAITQKDLTSRTKTKLFCFWKNIPSWLSWIITRLEKNVFFCF